jgi:hypothetical protein
MSDPTEEYSVSVIHEVRLKMAVLQRRALLFGVRDRVYAALDEIDRQLRTNPKEWGEPSWTFHGMGMTNHVGFRDRIRVNYSVHATAKVVIVRDMEPEPGHPLHRQE